MITFGFSIANCLNTQGACSQADTRDLVVVYIKVASDFIQM